MKLRREITQLLLSNRIVMGVSSPPAVLSKSDASATAAAVTIACLAALPSFAGEASLELAADDVIEFILVSIAEANLRRVNILNLKFSRTYSVTYLANAFPDAAAGGAFSPVREYHDIYMTFCGITMTRFGAMTRYHDIASQTPPWGP